MRKLGYVVVLLVGFSLMGACSDDDSGSCELSFSFIDDQPAGQVNQLRASDDRSNLPGFQVDIVVSADDASDGDVVVLSGGVSDATAVVANGQASFPAYTIDTDRLVELQVSADGCRSDTHTLRVVTATHHCQFQGLRDNQSLSCSTPGDDVSTDPGLQTNVTVACSDVDDGTEVVLLRDGQEAARGNLAGGSVQFDSVFLVGGGEDCRKTVVLDAVVAGDHFTVTLDAECCSAVGCAIFGYSPSDPSEDFLNPHTFNMSMDADSFTPGFQTQVGIQTDSSQVWKVGVRVTNLTTQEVTEYSVENISSDQVYVGIDPITLPEGQVRIEPLCYLNNSQDPFTYADQAQDVYVDSVPPECPVDLTCTIADPRVANVECQWTTPDDPGADHDGSGWDVRMSTSIENEDSCTATELASTWDNLQTVPGSESIPPSEYGHGNVAQFNPLQPGLSYCFGMRVVDAAGNESQCTTATWIGAIDLRQAWFSPCTEADAPCAFGRSVTSADLNCDGMRDIVVAAPDRHLGSVGHADGVVYVFFGKQSGFSGSDSPDLVFRGVPDSWAIFGAWVAGVGNFTDHNGADANCEDVLIGAPNDDYLPTGGAQNSGSAFLFRGRPTWSATSLSMLDADARFGYDVSGKRGWETFGARVASAGDVNGDGLPDVAISAPYTLSGSVFVFYGRSIPYASGSPTEFVFPADANVTITGRGDNPADWSAFCPDLMGVSGLAPAGDLDGDGHADVVVGAPGSNYYHDYYGATVWGPCATNPSASRAYIVYGSDSESEVLDVMTPGDRIATIQADSGGNIGKTRGLGGAVSGLGDINGDGHLDIAVSDPLQGDDSTSATDDYYGAVFVFFGNSAGFRGPDSILEVDDADLWLRSNGDMRDHFGIAISDGINPDGTVGGDFDGDGYSDMVVGTERFGTYDGSIWFLYGSSNLASVHGWVNWDTASFFVPPPAPCGRWGFVISYLGDTNGDQFMDLAVGDDQFPRVCDQTQQSRGRLAVFY